MTKLSELTLKEFENLDNAYLFREEANDETMRLIRELNNKIDEEEEEEEDEDRRCDEHHESECYEDR